MTETSTILLIDGSHLDRLRSKLGKSIDIIGLRTAFGTEEEPAETIYYRDVRDAAEHERLTSFFAWLERHDIEVSGSQHYAEAWYTRERYGSNLVELAIDAMDAANAGQAVAIVAGDPKLIPLLEELQDRSVRVTLISSRAAPSSIAPPPPLVALASEFIDLADDDRFLRSDAH